MRIACGSTIRRNWRRRGSPSAAAASCWPWSTDEDARPRTISAAYAASLQAQPDDRGDRTSLTSGRRRTSTNAGPERHAEPERRVQYAKLYQEAAAARSAAPTGTTRCSPSSPPAAPGCATAAPAPARSRRRAPSTALHAVTCSVTSRPSRIDRPEEPVREPVPLVEGVGHQAVHDLRQHDEHHARWRSSGPGGAAGSPAARRGRARPGARAVGRSWWVAARQAPDGGVRQRHPGSRGGGDRRGGRISAERSGAFSRAAERRGSATERAADPQEIDVTAGAGRGTAVAAPHVRPQFRVHFPSSPSRSSRRTVSSAPENCQRCPTSHRNCPNRYTFDVPAIGHESGVRTIGRRGRES